MTAWHIVPLEGSLARVREPGHAAAPVFLLLHGWTGDETVMEPFTRALPEGLWVAFRAPFSASRGGYSWLPEIPQGGSRAQQYAIPLRHLAGWLAELQERFPQADWSHKHWIGFSQGAGTILMWALHHPGEVRSLSVLAGFLPRGAEPLLADAPLQGIPTFVAHGTEDAIIPIGRARQMVAGLRQAGAQVTYCEDAVGHKVSAKCLRQWKQFWKEVIA